MADNSISMLTRLNSCKSVMPHFLWKMVMAYCDVKPILKLCTDKRFGNILNDDDWKRYFYATKPAIAIVKTTCSDMNNFWKYACYNHIACDSINDMLSKIESDNIGLISELDEHIEKDFTYYKVYVSQGKYSITSGCHYKYKKCSIEIIGDEVKKTVFDFMKVKTVTTIAIVSSEQFTITGITFINFSITYQSNSVNDAPKIELNNCIFYNKCNMNLTVISINDLIITGCIIKTSPLYIKIKSCDNKSQIINYNITYNTFLGCDVASTILDGTIVDKLSMINITNNTITKSHHLMANNNKDVSILVANNHISNVVDCFNMFSLEKSTVFDNNIFINTGTQPHIFSDNIIFNANNKFVDSIDDPILAYIIQYGILP